jgi:hypothetical protein
VEAFSEYLSKHRGSIFALLADLADEGFQIESLPYTQGADRQALLSRKLGQYFYGSPLATALSFGRDKGGRRDEKFLFTALTRPQQVEPWLAALRAVEAPLAGVYSLFHCRGQQSRRRSSSRRPAETRFHRLWKVPFGPGQSSAWLALACLPAVSPARPALQGGRAARPDRAHPAGRGGGRTRRYDAILDGLPKVNLTPDNLRALTGALRRVLQKRVPGTGAVAGAPEPGPQRDTRASSWAAWPGVMADSPDGAANTAGPGARPVACDQDAGGWVSGRDRGPAAAGAGQRPARPARR